MNVPSASHMGAVWERQIRTVRSILSTLLQDFGLQLDDEALRTLFCEAMAIVIVDRFLFQTCMTHLLLNQLRQTNS